MCARITLTTTSAEIADLFGLMYDLGQPSAPPRYNLAPTQLIPVVRAADGKRELTEMRWGLIPHWSREPKPGGFVNARAETAAEKPAFRDSFRRRRCLVPASGFYEWEHVGKKKQPYFFRNSAGGLFAYAALWDTWTGPDGPVDTVSVLTVLANDLVMPLHDRMPAILDRESFSLWLDPRVSATEVLMPLLRPYPVEKMECWPVSDRVNRAGVDEPGLTERIPAAEKPRPRQPTLFDL
jgi:putative SOS response-associated peptidase YedK